MSTDPIAEMERELTDRDRLSVCLSARLTLPLLPPRQMSSSASPASRAEPPLTQARSYHYHPHHLVSRLLCFAFAFRRNRDCPSSASVLWSVADESLGKRVTERERSERRLPPRPPKREAGGRASTQTPQLRERRSNPMSVRRLAPPDDGRTVGEWRDKRRNGSDAPERVSQITESPASPLASRKISRDHE